jgi:hypothetical protein
MRRNIAGPTTDSAVCSPDRKQTSVDCTADIIDEGSMLAFTKSVLEVEGIITAETLVDDIGGLNAPCDSRT